MEKKSFAGMDCSVAQCLDVVGEWWSLLIVRDAFLGFTRFEQFQRRLGISRNILDARLNRLVASGVLVKVPYRVHPPRSEYRLSDKGRDLWPVLTALRQWGDRYSAPAGPPVEMIHRRCERVTTAVMTCEACGDVMTYRDVDVVAGPGRDEAALGARATPGGSD